MRRALALGALLFASTSYAGWTVEKVSGCTYDYAMAGAWGVTLGCRKEGGQLITLTGDFGDQSSAANIEVSFLQRLVGGPVTCVTTPGDRGQADTTMCTPDEIKCTSVMRVSSTELTCLSGAGQGLYWRPKVVNVITGAVASQANETFGNATLSYLDGGYEVRKEGVALFTDLMTPGSGPGTFRGSSSLLGIQKQQLAEPNDEGTLDSNIWRVQGINGHSGATCYEDGQQLQDTDFAVGECGTFWGYGTPFEAPDFSTVPMYNDNKRIFTPDPTIPTSRLTFDATNSNFGWGNKQGGLTSIRVGSTVGGLGFVPYNRDGITGDFMPGSIDFRMVNMMDQTITALSVRYSLQCRNMFQNTTSITLGYTHHGGDNWYFNMLTETTLKTDGPCDQTTDKCNITCAANDDSCWDNNKFVDVEIDGLDWHSDKYFYLRWAINTDASMDDFGDVCRITDLEVTPFIVDYGSEDRSLKVAAVDTAFVDMNASIAYQSNYTVEMTIFPLSHLLPPANGNSGIPRVVPADGTFYTLLSSYYVNQELEWSYQLEVLAAGWHLVVRQTKPTTSLIWSSSVVISADQWTHVAIQHEYDHAGHYFRLYLAGNLMDESPVVADHPGLGGQNVTTDSESLIRLGQLAATASTDAYTGFFDEFRLWDKLRTATELVQDQDNNIVNTEDPNLVVYLKFDTWDSTTKTFPNAKLSSSIKAYTGPSPTLSKITPNTLLSLTGGAVNCPEPYVVPGGRVTCNFTVADQWGSAKPTFDHSEFKVRIISGEGIIGPLDPDWTGTSWTFTYFATNATGTAVIQAYTKHNDPFVAPPAVVTVIQEACRGCEFREQLPSGSKVYSCQVGTRRFLRADITNIEGTCPM